MRPILIFFATLLLAACGTKGPLVMPPGPAKPPLFGNPKPVEIKPEAAKVPAKNETLNQTNQSASGLADDSNKAPEGQQ